MERYKFFKKTIANVNVIECPGNPEDPTVILLHGYGANATDLTFFPDHTPFKKIRPTWIFPEGIELAEGLADGRSWFPLRIAELLNQSSLDQLANLFPAELFLKPVEAINNLIAEINIPTNQIILGGFSQGAMVSTDTVLTNADDFLSLVIMSGALVKKNEWQQAASKKNLSFLQSHGTQDPILPWQGAKELYELLISCGVSGEFISFEGGHSIPNELFQTLVKSLEEDRG